MTNTRDALKAQRDALVKSLDTVRDIHETVGFSGQLSMELNFVESHLREAIGDLDEAIAMFAIKGQQ